MFSISCQIRDNLSLKSYSCKKQKTKVHILNNLEEFLKYLIHLSLLKVYFKSYTNKLALTLAYL